MSKPNLPTCKLDDESCNTLFTSVSEKLKIENPTFFYPIYKKLVDENATSEELKNLVLDSKYKCKEILEKIIDSDDDEVFSTDEEDIETDDELSNEETMSNNLDIQSDNQSDTNSIKSNEEDNEIQNDTILEKEIKDTPIEDDENNEEDYIDAYDNYDDKEVEEAINNTYLATAIIERMNKSTNEKTQREEIIHIKKTALLDPLKVMQDEYVIPGRLQNKTMNDEALKNTTSKLNSYNNCGHVESLFLYLGNKLVETGKCPSFPYYYGCINGEDPNYHHNITDEYETVYRTKWFKDRVKNDFDLLIIEDNDEIEDDENQSRKIRRPSNCIIDDNESDNESDFKFSDDDDDDDDDEDNEDDEDDEDVETETKFSIDDEPEEPEEKKTIDVSADSVVDAIDTQLDTINKTIEETELSNNEENQDEILPKIVDVSFIKGIDDEDFEFSIDINDNDNDTTLEGGNVKEEDQTEYQTEDKTEDKTEDQNKEHSEDHSEDQSENNSDIDDFIEELSDIDEDNLSITDFEDKPGSLYYVKCEKMPVSLSLMEKLDDTLDNMLDNDYSMSETEWFGMFFQVAFGLSVAQKYFNFVHNDLHSSNVMFKKTLLKHLYFQVNNQYYRIPTYGKITKIIDFARGTFKLGDRWVFSDQFKEDGDASGQYDYPVDGSLKNCEHKPNPSFDLVRLGTTVIQRLEDAPKVREFVEQITLDDNENSLCYDEDTFELYVDIAHNCHNAIPIEVMMRKEFKIFKINKQNVPKGQYVFKY